MSKKNFSGSTSNGTLKKRMIGSGKDEDHNVDKMVSHYTDIIEQQRENKVTGLGSKILNDPTLVRTIYFIIKFGFIVMGLAYCGKKGGTQDETRKALITTFVTKIWKSMKQNPQDFGAISNGLGRLTSGLLRPIGSLLSKIPIIGSVITLFSMLETGLGDINKFITDNLLGTLYDQNFVLKLMTLYDTIPKDNARWEPANFIKGSAILLSIINALICGKGQKVCRLSKILEKVAYFVPIVMMIHGDILAARKGSRIARANLGYGPLTVEEQKKDNFCNTLITIATQEASGLFASENEKINNSAKMMGEQPSKIRQMLLEANERRKDRIKERRMVKAERKKKKEGEVILSKSQAEDLVKKQMSAKDANFKKDVVDPVIKRNSDELAEEAEVARQKNLKPGDPGFNPRYHPEWEKKQKKMHLKQKKAAEKSARAKEAKEAKDEDFKKNVVDPVLKKNSDKLAKEAEAAEKSARAKEAIEEKVNEVTTKVGKFLNSFLRENSSNSTTSDTQTSNPKTEPQQTIIQGDFEHDVIAPVLKGKKQTLRTGDDNKDEMSHIIENERDEAEKLANKQKAAERRRSLAKGIVPPSVSFLSGLFGSKKNKKKSKNSSIKKSNKKKTNKKKN